MIREVIERVSEPVELAQLPQAIPPEYRPLWRVGQIILILDFCGWGGKCTQLQLFALSWGLKSPSTRDNILALSREDYPSLTDIPLRFDPTLVYAVNLAAGFGLVEKSGNDSVKLTGPGTVLVSKLRKDKDIFATEKKTLEQIGKRLTQSILQTYIKDPRL